MRHPATQVQREVEMHQPVKYFKTGGDTNAAQTLFCIARNLSVLLLSAPFTPKLHAQSQKEHWPAPRTFTYHYQTEAEAAGKLDLDHRSGRVEKLVQQPSSFATFVAKPATSQK
jgi:hypothetical protein